MNEQRFVEVYRAKNNPQALAMKQALEDAGIRAAIENELLQGAVGELPMGWATAPRVMVESTDAFRARELLERLDRAEPTAPEVENGGNEVATCLACGTRLPDDAASCPACGWSYKSGEPEDEEAEP
jgi:ribosomal protein L40E